MDECHRGSAAEDSAWREILEYFSTATQIGMTATPKETKYVSNIDYFGKPIYSYSLKQGIHDGCLAPYEVIKVHIDRDIEGYRPEPGKVDREGREVEDRIYNQKDFDRTFVIDDRTKLVAKKISDFLRESEDRFQKTIVFYFASLDDFLTRWRSAECKQAIVDELEQAGVSLEALAHDVGKDLDPFDLVCHVAYDRPPLTRRERADRVRTRNVFTKYGPQARTVLDALLNKYQDEGVTNLDDPRILPIKPFDAMGTPLQLITHFGSRGDFERAVRELQSALYEGAA